MRALIVGLVLVMSGLAWGQSTPSFSDFSTGPMYRGARAAPDLTAPQAANYRTRLRQAAPQPANFASNFRLVTWGCGTTCETGAVIDQRNGRVIFFPFYICCTKNEEPLDPIEFKGDSALIIFTGLRSEEEPDGRHYYRFTGEGFTFLKTVRLQGPTTTAPPAAPPSVQNDGAFPIADVEGKCTRMMKSQPFIGECIRREQPAYDLSKSLWDRLSPEQKRRSRTWEGLYGTPAIETNPAYYQNLIQAISQEIERGRQEAPPPKFRY